MGRIVWALVCSLRTVIVWAVGERSRTLYNGAVFETLIVRDGCIAEPRYAAPFRLVLAVDEFEQGSLERQRLIRRLGSADRRATPLRGWRDLCRSDLKRRRDGLRHFRKGGDSGCHQRTAHAQTKPPCLTRW
jgi:hypothetical protein